MPQGENCEVGKAGDQRENNLQMNERGHFYKKRRPQSKKQEGFFITVEMRCEEM